MSTGALQAPPSSVPAPAEDRERPQAVHPLPAPHDREAVDPEPCDKATLLGLYHGYDQARIALARVVAELGSQAAADEATRRRIWSRADRQGISAELFHTPSAAELSGVGASAHSAALAAFATVSEKAEALLRRLRSRWPELCDDAGGPLPAPAPAWELD